MQKPSVNIEFRDASTSLVTPVDDRVMGLCLTGAGVAGGVVLEKAYVLFSLADAEALGIEETGDNAFAWKQISDFYTKSGEGAELWILLTDASHTIHEDFFAIGGAVDKLKEGSGGRVYILGAMENYTNADYRANTLESASAQAQVLADKYIAQNESFAIIIGANWIDMDNLPDFADATRENVMIYISGDTIGAYRANIGSLLGDYANLPVHRKASRVKNGELLMTVATFTNGEAVDDYQSKYEAILAKKYMFIHRVKKKTVYKYIEDPMLIASSSTFNTMPKRRVMDKLMSIANDVMQNELNDELRVSTEDPSKLADGVAVGLEQILIGNIESQMMKTGEEEIVAIDVFVDPNQDISEGRVLYVLKPTPFNYMSQVVMHLSYNV